MSTMTTSTTLRSLITTAIFSTLALGVSTVCSADQTDAPKVVVNYSDLNLSNREGANVLFSRIQRAAGVVCGSPDRDLGLNAHREACMQKAIANAIADVGQPMLFTVYNAHSAKPTPIILASQR